MKYLRVLIEELAFMTEPEDLLVSPPAEFATIPVYGISIGIGGPTMIERNSVVYASTFSPYLECVCKVQVCDRSQDMSLASAIFAAAYEEPGHGKRKSNDLLEHEGIQQPLRCMSFAWMRSDRH